MCCGSLLDTLLFGTAYVQHSPTLLCKSTWEAVGVLPERVQGREGDVTGLQGAGC